MNDSKNTKIFLELTDAQTEKLFRILDNADPNSIKSETNQTNNNELMRVPELCKLTGWAHPTIYAKTSKKEIPFIKRGKSIFFERSKIMLWLKTNEKGVGL